MNKSQQKEGAKLNSRQEGGKNWNKWRRIITFTSKIEEIEDK